MQKHSFDEYDPRIAKLIKHKAKKLSRSPGFRREEASDLAQELSLHVVAGLNRHNPARGSFYTLADRIVASKSISLFYHRAAKKRDHRRLRRLTKETRDLAEVHSDPPLIDQEIDVAETIGTLPPNLRKVAHQLMKHGIRAAGRRCRMSQSKLRRMRRQIAEHFRDRKLAPEKSSPSATRSRATSVHI